MIMMGYYDIVLGLIPLSLAGLTGVLFVAGLSLVVAIGLASVVTVGLMLHAMFVNAPVPRSGATSGQGPGTATEAGAQTSPSLE